MNTLILTHRPARFERLAGELASRGHEVHVAAIPRTDAAELPPPGHLGGFGDACELVVVDVPAGDDPRLVRGLLELLGGHGALRSAAIEGVDPERMRAAVEAGFEDVWPVTDEQLGLRIGVWENLARWNAWSRRARETVGECGRDTDARAGGDARRRPSALAGAQLEAVLQSVQEGVLVVDMRGGIVFANDTMARIMGSSSDALTRDARTSDAREAILGIFEMRAETGEVLADEERPLERILRGETLDERRLRVRHRETGQEWHIVLSGQPVCDTLGRPELGVVVVRDLTPQVLAEESLREKTAQLQVIRDYSSDNIYIKDRDGRVLMANPRLLAVLGRSESEIVGRTDADFLPDPQAADEVMALDRRIMESGQAETLEESVRFPDGSLRTWLSTKVPVRDAAGEVVGLLGISREITERKRAVDELRASEERLRQLVHANPAGMLLCDVSGRIHEANEAYLAIVGRTRESFRDDGLRWDAITPPEWLRVDEAHVREAMETGATTPYEKEYLRPDGTRVPVLVGFALIGDRQGPATTVAAFVIDLSRERAVAEALHRSEETFRVIAESMPGFVWASTPDGRFAYLNPRWCAYTGIPLEEALRGKGADTLDPEQAASSEAKWRHSIATGEPFENEVRIRRHDGVYRWFLLRTLPVRDSEGRIVHWIGTGIDLEDKKRLEESLLRAKEDLEAEVRIRTAELERKAADLGRSNAELQRLAFVASHDLQEPLRIVVSYAQLLARRFGQMRDPWVDESIGFMTQAAGRMRQLIDDLLAFSRVESDAPRFSRVAVADCVRSAVAHHEKEILETRAEVAVADLPEIEADEAQLWRLFDQLLANALKFRSEEPPRLAVSALAEEGAWVFSVRDNGIGISPEFASTVFEPFRRLHTWEEYPGTGIGLAICRRVVEGHGGRIWVEPAEGGGSVFRFRLPARQVATAIPVESTRSGAAEAGLTVSER